MYSEEDLQKIKNLVGKVEKQRLLNIIYQLSELENNLKNSTQKTILFQAGVIKICSNQTSGDIMKLEEKVIILEQKLNKVSVAPAGISNRQTVNSAPTRAPQREAVPQKLVAPTKQTNNGSADWSEIVATLKNNGKLRLFTSLVNTTLNQLNDQTWEIEFPNGLTEFNRKILEDSANRNDLIKTIATLTGNVVNLKLKDGKKEVPTENTTSGLDDLGIDINIIE